MRTGPDLVFLARVLFAGGPAAVEEFLGKLLTLQETLKLFTVKPEPVALGAGVDGQLGLGIFVFQHDHSMTGRTVSHLKLF